MEKFLIVGGGFNNKGAEAMLFTLITELRDKYSGCEIFVEVDSDTLFKKENNTYDVNLIKYSSKARAHLVNTHLRISDKVKNVKESELSKVIKQVDVIFDISGYSLSVQRGKFPSRRTLQTISLAKLFNKKLIFMPQSFGPFNFPRKWRMPLSYIKQMLSYADMIFCREPQGYELLNSLGLKNIVLSNDMVIQSAKPYENVFLKEIEAEDVQINTKSVLVIPNMRVYERIEHDKYMGFYNTVISHLLDRGYNIYLTYYDSCDKEICASIKEMFADNDKVIHIPDSWNFRTFENVLPKFEFIVSSRFHSIVHAYKQYVPAIVFSWAIKYKELLKSVNQADCNFDCREELDLNSVKSKIDYLVEHRNEESHIIEEKVKSIQKTNCFDMIWNELNSLNINRVTGNNLCISCGMCASVCPTGCISAEFNGVGLDIKIDKEKCINCKSCLNVCSANEVKKYDNTPVEDYLVGDYKSVLRVKCKDESLLQNSTSGGAVTGLVKTLLETGRYDSAFLVDGYNYDNHLTTKRFVKGDDLRATAKSRYLTVSHADVISYVKKNPDEKIILVGTPCALSSFKNFIGMRKLDKSKYLLLGLFCDKTMNYGVKKYFAQHKASRGKVLDKLYFRTKEVCGWPGDVDLVYTDGSNKMMSREERMKVKTYFVPERCLYCLDKLNKNADISFGDNYIKDNADKSGISSVVIRTEQGEAAWDSVQELFEVSPDSVEALVKAQGLDKKSVNVEFAKIKGLLRGEVSVQTLAEYKDALSKIKVGLSKGNVYRAIKSDMKFRRRKAKFAAMFDKLKNKFNLGKAETLVAVERERERERERESKLSS